MSLKNHLKVIHLSNEARDDIEWWLRYFRVFNGKSTVKKPICGLDMVSDSSREGYAVHLGMDWCYSNWEGEAMFNSGCGHQYVDIPDLDREDLVNINVLELWPVIVGIKHWGELFRGHEINVVVDNMQVLFMLRTGRSVNSRCMTWLRDLFWTCVILDIDVNPIYIRSEDNIVADTLSCVLYRKQP